MVDISPEDAIRAVWMPFRWPRKCRMAAASPQKSNISTCNYRLLEMYTIRRKIKRTAFKKIARYDVAVTMMMIITVPIDSCLVWLLQ